MVTKKTQIDPQSYHNTPAVLRQEPEKMEHEIQTQVGAPSQNVVSNESGSGAGYTTSSVSSPGAQYASSVITDQNIHNHNTQNKKDLEQHAKELVKELDQETRMMKKSRGKESKPPKNTTGGKNSKRSMYGGIAALFVLGALVVGSFVGVRLVQQNQENRSLAAICCNGGECNDGTFFFSDPRAPQGTCTERAEEACREHGGLRSGGDACNGDPVDNLCGDGTPADGCWVFRCPRGCGNDPEGNETSCDGAEPDAYRSLVDCYEARLDSNECGQIDKHKNGQYCGVITVQCGTNCVPTLPTPTTQLTATPTQRAVCNSTCTTDSQCTGQANLFCKVDKTWSAWVDKTSDISNVGSGDLGSFNEYIEGGVRKQYFVRGGKKWYRSNSGGSWSSWQDVTVNVNNVGSGTVTSFKAYLDEQGVTRQHLVKGGKMWYQHNQGGWSGFSDVTSNVSSVGSGTITGFSTYVAYGTNNYQHLVRGGKMYARDSVNGWSSWIDVTHHVSSVGSGTITSLTSQYTTAKVEQYLVRGNKLWYRSGVDKPGNCRLRSNPDSSTCSPAEATPTPTPQNPSAQISLVCTPNQTLGNLSYTISMTNISTTQGFTESHFQMCINPGTNSSHRYVYQNFFSGGANWKSTETTSGVPNWACYSIGLVNQLSGNSITHVFDRSIKIGWTESWANKTIDQLATFVDTAISAGNITPETVFEIKSVLKANDKVNDQLVAGRVKIQRNACLNPTITPTKTPTPTSTVTPPPGTLACTGITPVNPVIALGTSKEFTCAGVFPVSASVKFAKFQFKVDGGSYIDFGTPADNVYKATMTARDPGGYVVRCQVCGGTSVAAATCSSWQELTP